MKKKLLSIIISISMLISMFVPSLAANDHIELTIADQWFQFSVPDYLISADAPRIEEAGTTFIGLDAIGDVATYKCTGPVSLKIWKDSNISGGVLYAEDLSFAPYLMPDIVVPSAGNGEYTLAKPGVYLVQTRELNAGMSAIFIIEDMEAYTPELKAFYDVAEGRWSHGAIMEMVEKGMFNGVTDPDVHGLANFDPTGTMSRAQFITVAVRYLWADELNAMGAGKTWYSNAYDLAVSKGLITKTEFPLNSVTNPMTREEMALIAVRAAKAQGDKADTLVPESTLKDYNSIGAYYKDYALEAFSMGLITGYGDVGTFAAKETLTREQGAMVAYRLMNKDARADVSLLLPMTIREGQATARLAREGDIFIRKDGTKITLKKGPNGILGEGQGVAPDQYLKTNGGKWVHYSYQYDESIDGKLTNSFGNDINKDIYRVNASTGEGHWLSEWRVLESAYPAPDYEGKTQGELSKDIHKLYYWDVKTSYWYSNLDMNQTLVK